MNKVIIFILSIIIVFSLANIIISQTNGCGVDFNYSGITNPGDYFGGWYKPSRSDIGGATSDNYFPVLIVFVQFKIESGDSTTTNFESWPARRSPNYYNNVIATSRGDTTINWWNRYNDFAISDYWHEYSRGRLHVYGNKLSIILPETIDWYKDNGGMSKVNYDIYNSIKPLISDWTFFDKWKLIQEGEFSFESDGLVDMMYIVFRSRKDFLFENGGYYGLSMLGKCDNVVNNRFTIDSSGSSVTRIFSADFPDPLGSGVRVFADSTSSFSRQTFLDIATHEHGHYLFLFNHKPYSKMEGTGVATHEFGLSPWESIKLGYILPKLPNYNNSTTLLYDYSSRGGTAGTTGEVLLIPVNYDTTEFFLIANRRKVSDWDRRMGGDTLAEKSFQYLKNVNPEYGKGLYIYHIKNGFNFEYAAQNDMDMECADGLWKFENAGFNRPVIYNPDSSIAVLKKTYPLYNNDNPDPSITSYNASRDEMSEFVFFSQGSPDVFSGYNVLNRGTHSLFTNENDYWYSNPRLGDRWDAWNVGYNVIFSPYSSPNTKDMLNNQTGIFICYKSLYNPTNEAQLEIFRAGYGGKTEDQILEYTPPSRPMGLRVLECDSLPNIGGYLKIKLRWFHNMEPDMSRPGTSRSYKRYVIYRSIRDNMSQVPYDALQYPENYYTKYDSVDIDDEDIPEYTDTCNSRCNVPPVFGEPWYEYPVRYRVQAIDKYEDKSVLSDFAKTSAWIIPNSGGGAEEGGDNFTHEENKDIPKEYSLSQNYPNPFNPTTNVQFDLPEDNFVTIKVYDITGKEIYTLVSEFKQAGRYTVSFNGSSTTGGLASGIYYYRIKAGNFEQVRKMMLIK